MLCLLERESDCAAHKQGSKLQCVSMQPLTKSSCTQFDFKSHTASSSTQHTNIHPHRRSVHTHTYSAHRLTYSHSHLDTCVAAVLVPAIAFQLFFLLDFSSSSAAAAAFFLCSFFSHSLRFTLLSLSLFSGAGHFFSAAAS